MIKILITAFSSLISIKEVRTSMKMIIEGSDLPSLIKDYAEETFTDDDGILVLVTLFSNDKRFLYELDFFKADFSNLIQYPQPKNN